MQRFDYVIVGSGIGGMVLAAMLARRGERVCVLERHYLPGGYGHTFSKQGYDFCAELHYIWNCGQQQDFGRLLQHLGLENEIRFTPLNPDGYDHFNFPSFRYELVKGFDRNTERLAAEYPEFRREVADYFSIISSINREVYQLPVSLNPALLLKHPLKFHHFLRYRKWTTEKLFDRLRLPLPLRSILAGQMGDIGVPPASASLIVQAVVTCGYDAGVYVPERGFGHLFETLVQYICRQPGCQVLLKNWVVSFRQTGKSITAACTKKGRRLLSRRFIFNGDPAALPGLLQAPLPARFQRQLNYEYSPSSFTVYLGLRNLDLADYGFGNWNVWHYPHDDLNRVYAEQVDDRRLENPFLFMSTPTLHCTTTRLAPAGCQQLVVATFANYDHFAELKQLGRGAYKAEKQGSSGELVGERAGILNHLRGSEPLGNRNNKAYT